MKPDFNGKRKRESERAPIKLARNDSESKVIADRAVETLPILEYEDKIVSAVNTRDVVIISGDTGSGKSTQVPRMLMRSGLFDTSAKLVCTQPRRVAAVTIAERVAEEDNSIIGQRVGYSVRFFSCYSPATRIKYVTDGVLLRECILDRNLSAYSVVIVDEAHERSIQTDIILGLLKQALKSRKSSRNPLKLLLMSATLNLSLFHTFFTDPSCSTSIVSVHGRQFPVEVYYTNRPQDDCLDACLWTIINAMSGDGSNAHRGHVLVFLPGQEDIEGLYELLMFHSHFLNKNDDDANNNHHHDRQDVEIYCLYAGMSNESQLQVIKPDTSKRRIILSTNICETSLTIPGVEIVVDCGYVKQKILSSSSSISSASSGFGIEALKTVQISQAQAKQRAGRCGRDCPGTCYRVYTEESYLQLPIETTPEIERSDLGEVVLQLIAIGVSNPVTFDFLSPPSPSSLKLSLQELLVMKAITVNANEKCVELTDHGQKMSRLPLKPLLSHWLLSDVSSINEDQVEVLQAKISIISILSSDHVFHCPVHDKEKAFDAHQRMFDHDGDIMTLLNVMNGYKGNSGYLNRKKKKRNGAVDGQHAADDGDDWCRSNFISKKSLMHAIKVEEEICELMHVHPFLVCELSQEKKKLLIVDLTKSMTIRLARRRPPSEGKRGCYVPIWPVGCRVEAFVHPSSALFGRNPPPEFVVYAEMVETAKNYMRNVTAVDGRVVNELMSR